jgi:hypothetical protein
VIIMAQNIALHSDAAVIGHADHTETKPSLLARLINAVHVSRQRRAESEVAQYIRMNGGQLTDEVEREISRRYGRMVE